MTERDPLDRLAAMAGSSEAPDPDFAGRLLAELTDDLTATAAEPVGDTAPAMELMEEDEMNAPNRKWLPLLVAAAIIALIVGIVVVSTGEDSEQPVIQPTPDGTESTAPTTSEPAVDQSAAATAVGEAFVDAFVVGDPEAAIAQLSATPQSLDVFGAADPSELARLFAWFDTVGWSFEPRGCESTEPDQVACTVAHTNDWYGPVDLAPVEGTFLLKVEDEQITAGRFAIGADDVEAFQPFIDYVTATNPDDIAVMFDTGPGGNLGYPQLTDEALTLFEQNTASYVAADGE